MSWSCAPAWRFDLTSHTSASQDPCDDSASAPPLLTAVAVLGSLEARHHTHTHTHIQVASISGITPGDRSYLPHCIRSMRLLSDRCTQNAAPSASFHAQYHPRLGHPLIQQTPQDPCTALGRIRAVLSRSRKHRGFSRASGDVCCHKGLGSSLLRLGISGGTCSQAVARSVPPLAHLVTSPRGLLRGGSSAGA